MNAAGQQVLLINEFKPSINFYKWLAIEEYIRAFGKIFPNSYTLAFFACCREIYSPERHIGYEKGKAPRPASEGAEEKAENDEVNGVTEKGTGT